MIHKATLTLQTGDTDIAANDVLGQLHFQAPDEGAGTDAILVAAGIAAISEGDFSASNNATSLVFKTGASEAAAEKMRIGSNGNIGIGSTNSTVAKVFINHDGDTDDSGLRVYSNLGQTVPLVYVLQDGAGSTAPAVYIRNDDVDGIALHLERGDSNVTPAAFANQLFIEDDSNSGLTIGSPTNGVGSVVFGDSGDADIAKFQYYHDGDSMRFTVNAAERMRIHSNGVLSATAGIALGVSTANTASNVLDDYEEGDFTPIYRTTGDQLQAITYNGWTSGRYTKVGRLVAVTAAIASNAVTRGSPSGNLRIGGLPFTVASATGSTLNTRGAVVMSNQNNWSTNHTPNNGNVVNDTTEFDLAILIWK